MRIKFLTLWLILLLSSSFAQSEVADLKPSDVHSQVNEFLYNHIHHKRLSTEIMCRSIHNFIHHLDPLKTYFTHNDLSVWLEPNDELLEKTLSRFYKNDFSTFEEIYKKMLSCIERRETIESKIDQMDLLTKASYKDFDEKSWSKDENELQTRLLTIRSIQSLNAKKLDQDFQNKFFALLNKRRIWRESEIKGSKQEEQNAIIYSYLLKSIATALDSQTDYFPPEEAKMMMQQVQQRLMGIGVRLIDDLTGFKIMELIEGGPAQLEGSLQVNDKIIAVNNEPIVGMDIYQAVQLIQGKKDTDVALTILREQDNQKDQTFEATITRGDIVIEENRFQANLEPFADGVIAHIVLHGFYQDPNSSSSEDLFNKISEIKKNNHLKGIILDLRNNSGGLLVQGVAVSSFFIGKGIVASTKQYDGTLLHFRNEQSKTLWDGPLIVLMNKASASAAEIVAQCMQDYGRALVVGDTQSFGKGTYQVTSILPSDSSVNPKGEYKITQGMYYTVSGKTPQIVGVASDIVVPSYLSEVEYGEKYSKYPVPNSSIDANYDDKLLDILPWNRSRYQKNYVPHLQTKMCTYTKHLETLKLNSQKRLEANQDYQHLLKGLKEPVDNEKEYHFSKNDLQLMETYCIMKDMIYFHEKDHVEQKAS